MRIIVEQAEYNADRHTDLLARAGADYDLAEQLISKHFLLGEVKADDNLLGIFVFHVDTLIGGEKEFVFVHALSDKAKIGNFTELALPFIKQLARQNGIKSIRIHTDSESMQRLYKKVGFKYSETILTMDIE